jgi:hypothetical protein
MFYVRATLQNPAGVSDMRIEQFNRFPREAYVTWDRQSYVPVFLGINNPPRPVSREEAEQLLSECQKSHGWMYDHNLRIVPA